MSPKNLTKFVCQKCGYESASWLGKCPNCGEWGSLAETIVATPKEKRKKKKEKIASPVKLSEIKTSKLLRISTGIGEFDRVLGGGLVPGSVILLAGEPGIGKSTLMLQVAVAIGQEQSKARIPHFRGDVRPELSSKPDNGSRLTRNDPTNKTTGSVLYVSGEESAEQLSLRAQRLKIKGENLLILEETNVEGIIEQISNCLLRKAPSEHKFQISNLIIIDSIQSLYTDDLTGTPGSIGQVRECARKLFNIAKDANIPMFFIGHITKEGAIAGPKTIEHLVDTVLYLEGERILPLRILRSFKNRFGPTDEVGVFQMGTRGLEEVVNPSQLFLGEKKKAAGSAITVTIQGTRPILAEVESLVVPTKLAFPRRIGSGVSFSRLQVICAILEKRLRVPLGKFDVYVSVSGGLRITEPAADLAIALSIISSYKNRALPLKMAVIGEVGLLGEIRQVSFLEKREKEAKKLGFEKIISPKTYKDLCVLVRKFFA